MALLLFSQEEGGKTKEARFWTGRGYLPELPWTEVAPPPDPQAVRGFEALPLGIFLEPEPEIDEEEPLKQDSREPKTPHGSCVGFWERHGSSDAWKETVWDQYLTQPAVLLPVSLAVSAALISHWDPRLEKQWQGVLGGRQNLGNIGV